VRNVPYATARRTLRRGILVSTLNLAGDVTKQPDDHQAQFIGERPCHADGTPMTELGGGAIQNKIAPDLVAGFTFSQKPARGHYIDYFEKMTAYATMLESQAAVIEPGVSARVNRVEEPEPEDHSPFHYLDTASSRVDINAVTAKLELDKIAIFGLGGTGSYVLDLVAKAPVAAIHLIDGDVFNTHNAFRAPGAPSIEELREQPFKVDYFKGIYSRMHKDIVPHAEYVDESNVERLLRGMPFAFICLDKGKPKALLLKKLDEYGIPFVDVGMGLFLKDEMLGGILRVTTSTPTQRVANARIPCGEEDADNEYDKNIQIADMNALNAALAVMKWKKLFGFYADNEREHYSTYTIDTNLLTSDET